MQIRAKSHVAETDRNIINNDGDGSKKKREKRDARRGAKDRRRGAGGITLAVFLLRRVYTTTLKPDYIILMGESRAVWVCTVV